MHCPRHGSMNITTKRYEEYGYITHYKCPKCGAKRQHRTPYNELDNETKELYMHRDSDVAVGA